MRELLTLLYEAIEWYWRWHHAEDDRTESHYRDKLIRTLETAIDKAKEME